MAILELWGEREDQDRAVSTGSFSNERSEFSRNLVWKNVVYPDDLTDSIVNMVGITSTAIGDGALQRVTPKADPQFPWMVADAILGLQGIGQSDEIEGLPSDAMEVPLAMDSYGLWKDYECKVRFSQRPYPVLPDTKIVVNTL